jgi:hypothetical protein
MVRLNNVFTQLCRDYPIILNIQAFVAIFLACFTWHAYRLGYSAPTYEGYTLWSMDYKILLVIFHILGYALSKFYGIKFCPELNRETRRYWMIIFHAISQVILIIFGAVPPPYNALVMFLNGMPLHKFLVSCFHI